MIHFKSAYELGNATFWVGGVRRDMKIGALEYHAICLLLNEACNVGEQKAAEKLKAFMAEWK